MRAELIVKGRSLTGTSDLTLLAPIIPGFVPSLGTVTYKSRVKALLTMLQGSRVAMHEYSMYRPFADAVERVAMIHSFRVAVLEPEDKVMLAVTFDATWESYIRVLWQKVGTLLDIIFCNTEGYVVSDGASFEAWCAWVRKVQVETAFFYTTHGLTVQDAAYLRGAEQIQRQLPAGAAQDLAVTRHHVVSPEDMAFAASNTEAQGAIECLRQGLLGLAVLYRLTETYLPGTPDGDVLLRATHDLLQEFISLAPAQLPREIAGPMRKRFGRQLDWLASAPRSARTMPTLPDNGAKDMYERIQAGILAPHSEITHGCLVLIAVETPFAGALLLEHLLRIVTTEKDKPDKGGQVCGVSISYEGFRALGLSERQLAMFPQEFREGMEARASMLGDFRINHPRRWRLPVHNWPSAVQGAKGVDMAAVHVVVELRIGAPNNLQFDPANPAHPLYGAISAIANESDGKTRRAGVRILHVQELRRLFNANRTKVVEHFGFADGVSDPVFDKRKQGKVYRNRVHLGEFLVGRDSEADHAPAPKTPEERERMEWLRDGSFLVVRKLSQHVDRLHNAVQAASDATKVKPEEILAKMMGRKQDGTPLANPAAIGNDFDYTDDAEGSHCPFHAHIRRGNPRPQDADQVVWGPVLPAGGRRPRLMRRGMSYGPRFTPPAPGKAAEPDHVERGIVFMAYNASIAEQFEVVQRWMTGGNASGGHSRHSDPFLGVPDWNEQRIFRFEDAKGNVRRINLDRAPSTLEEPLPFVRLEWGIYLFAPSIAALRKLRATAAGAGSAAAVWSVDEGEAEIQRLLAVERELGEDAARRAWKIALEDPEEQRKFRSAGVWAAIRARHGGALRTPFGVLVADRTLAHNVLADKQGRYTVAGYHERMLGSIGEIYLGLDAGPRYDALSDVANRAVSEIRWKEAFELAFSQGTEILARMVEFEKGLAGKRGLPQWELDMEAQEIIDGALAAMCQEWFGLPDAEAQHGALVPGSWRWDWREGQPPIYPAHFTAPSRYLFQPRPGPEVKDYGERIGKALVAAISEFIAPHRRDGTVPKAPGGRDARLAERLLNAFPAGPEGDLVTARTFCGLLMGFLPTVDGNVRRTLNELLADGTFWSIRAAWQADASKNSFDKATRLLLPALVTAMQLRPMPELIWRRAVAGGVRIGEADVHAGDTVVVSLVSAMQQCLAEGSTDHYMVFGGHRTQTPEAPRHACPAYAAGMGAVIGLLAAFIAAPETCRPALAPLAFKFEGAIP